MENNARQGLSFQESSLYFVELQDGDYDSDDIEMCRRPPPIEKICERRGSDKSPIYSFLNLADILGWIATGPLLPGSSVCR